MIRKSVDVIVVGSGMGGLSAAAILARDGYRVLVAEQMPRIGGRCSTMEHKGYKCITGVIGVETEGIVESFYKSIHADFNTISAGKPHYLMNGKVLAVPFQGGMKFLLEKSGASGVSIDKIMSAMSKALKWKEPATGISLYDWVRQATKHTGIMDIFQTLTTTALMVNVNEISAQYFIRFIKELKGLNKFGYCPNGPLELPESLTRVIHKNGGEIWTRSQVTRITTDNGIVQGAVIKTAEKEHTIEASVVISDTGPQKTVELVGRKRFDRDYLQEMTDQLKPAEIICLQIGLDEPLFKQNHLLISGAKRINSLYQPTILCPAMAPKGKHLLIAEAAPESSESLKNEKNRKREIDACLDDISRLFPGFGQISTILLTGVYRDQWPGMRSKPGLDVPGKTTIINLYNVGDGVKQCGYTGLPAVVKSGITVAEEIQQRMGFIKGAGKVT